MSTFPLTLAWNAVVNQLAPVFKHRLSADKMIDQVLQWESAVTTRESNVYSTVLFTWWCCSRGRRCLQLSAHRTEEVGDVAWDGVQFGPHLPLCCCLQAVQSFVYPACLPRCPTNALHTEGRQCQSDCRKPWKVLFLPTLLVRMPVNTNSILDKPVSSHEPTEENMLDMLMQVWNRLFKVWDVSSAPNCAPQAAAELPWPLILIMQSLLNVIRDSISAAGAKLNPDLLFVSEW